MPELDEPKTFELVFKATPLFGTGGPKIASAYIGMGIFTADEDGRVFITTEENSFESLKGQIDSNEFSSVVMKTLPSSSAVKIPIPIYADAIFGPPVPNNGVALKTSSNVFGSSSSGIKRPLPFVANSCYDYRQAGAYQ